MIEIVGYDGELPDEGKPVFNCDCCGEPIYAGDQYTKMASGNYCDNCAWREYAESEEGENPYIDVEVHARLEDGDICE